MIKNNFQTPNIIFLSEKNSMTIRGTMRYVLSNAKISPMLVRELNYSSREFTENGKILCVIR